jgi:hypothetical protein
MSSLDFDRTNSRLRLLDQTGAPSAGPFVAYNNVDSHSKGPWPEGTFAYQTYLAHAEVADPDSEYGKFGILIFSVPDRIGMGVHSGREDIPDGLGRVGPQHCTLGCIRTTDEAMQAILAAMGNQAIASITVRTVAAPQLAMEAPRPSRTRRKKSAKSHRPPKSSRRPKPRALNP